MSFKKVAFITGASSGIGKQVALELAKDHELVLVSRNKESLEKVAQEALKISKNSNPLVIPLDVSDDQKVKEAVELTIKQKGKISLVFNNAGIFEKGTSEISSQQVKDIFSINVDGAFNVLRHTVPILKEQKEGYIINVSSILGYKAFTGSGAYSASKFALRGFSESLFHELAPFNVKVTNLSPAYVATPMAEKANAPQEGLIQVEDLSAIVRVLISLSPNALIKDLVVNAKIAVAGGFSY